ncbi:MAG TPA: DNA-3-methyladenine glycosylase [Baekduia sp.]|uniref:DNA-3-methyladenine glycosylase family protein n=1 Tax=Baekduia sp. TaxID=2600305 RepID=UPI002CF8408F|nr:DNA-3-methyladenine glycosylase [Baekduia sp.]HMJ34704.1 DNA-3-methyladenine glycosylase [Baekduia sp.]
MDDAAAAHLRGADPVLARLLDEVGPPPARVPTGDPYGALMRVICGQQLSVSAARAIYGRLLERFDGRPPTPAEILASDPEELRPAVGLSRAKTVTLWSIAQAVVDGELELDRLGELDDEALIAELTAIKGIGEWTAQIYLMVELGRRDVVAVGDLGIRRAVERAYGLDELPTRDELLALAEPWRPYRTAACWLLWQSLDNAPVPDPAS